MATYNGEEFLEEQLESMAEQTLLPAELVVADDGSTDAQLRSFANSQQVLLSREATGGRRLG